MCGEQNWLCRVRSSAPCRTGAWHKLAQQPQVVVEYFLLWANPTAALGWTWVCAFPLEELRAHWGVLRSLEVIPEHTEELREFSRML